MCNNCSCQDINTNIIIRDALMEYYHIIKNGRNKKLIQDVKELKEQYKNKIK